MRQHTNGPWKVMHHSGLSWIQNDKCEIVVPNVKKAVISDANAALIAAAPELLDALEQIMASDVETLQQLTPRAFQAARAAIAKAKM